MKRSRKQMTALVLSAVLLLVSIVQPAFALTATEQADALKDAGLFLGTGTDYNLSGLVTRDQGITLALRAQGLNPPYWHNPGPDRGGARQRGGSRRDRRMGRPYVAYALQQEPAITRGVAVRTMARRSSHVAADVRPQLMTFLAACHGLQRVSEKHTGLRI
jgi:hypothetical protein